MLDPLGSVNNLVDIADKLGMLQAVKAKLVRRPDPASDKLVTAISEISKIYSTLSNAYSEYLSLSFADSNDRAEDRKVLVRLMGGETAAEMAAARGHCSKITNIYVRYLTPWFSRVLNRTESQMMQELFDSLEHSDVSMVRTIHDVASWLADAATAVLVLVDAGDLAQADEQIKRDLIYVLPTRRKLAQAMITLFDLQAEFVAMSGAV